MTTSPSNPTERINVTIRISQQTYDLLRQAAHSNQRSIAITAERILLDALEGRSYRDLEPRRG